MKKKLHHKSAKADLKPFLLSIDSLFSDSSEVVHHDRNCTKKIKFKDSTYAVKSFKIPNYFQRVIYANFRKSKARRSFENSLKLLNSGINTPEPVGYVSFNNNFMIGKSFYISNYHNFEFDLRYVFDNFKKNTEVISSFIKQVILMHDNDIYHHDLTRQNVLINKFENRIDFCFIDNNRMSFKKMNLKDRMESISKLTNDLDELNILADIYSEFSDFNSEDCKYFILKGFNKSQNIKKFKRFIKGV